MKIQLLLTKRDVLFGSFSSRALEAPALPSPAAQIGGSLLAVHGGLSPSIHHLDQAGLLFLN